MTTTLIMAVFAALLAASAATAADSKIVWTSLTGSGGELRYANPDGSGVAALTSFDAPLIHIDAVISPDGSWVAYGFEGTETGDSGIGLVGTDGTNEHDVKLKCARPCLGDNGPEWSPAGDRLFFTRVVGPFNGPGEAASSAVLFSAATDGSDVQRFSEPGIDGVFEDYHPVYSPDGSYVIFLRVRDDPFNFAIFRINSDGSGLRQLTPWKLNADLADLSPATSGPTQDLIVFETYGSGAPKGKTQNIVTVPADCPTVADCAKQLDYLTDLKSGPKANFNPAWSPDGTRVAFTYFKDRGREKPPIGDIYTMSADGGDKRAVTKSKRFDFRPDWGARGL